MSAPNKFSGCSSCVNKLCDPDQCKTCDDESNWEGADSEDAPEEDSVQTLSLFDLKNLIGDR